ncbi:MAG: hypothetical protein PHX44_08135 [Sulfurimonas sp.]|uniref:hypothetical protein n=1 Tax=Sulfurimonas sp. TaxID=2022749 RepID=UPI00261C9DE7|nr:hypothetical protein [Sulfurimonas sp.]MDD2653002.1 hypothetical protein [Sulfurimonas sp.]MDD3452448.1 hypothetical protein [Sulfurimonas sp.]
MKRYENINEVVANATKDELIALRDVLESEIKKRDCYFWESVEHLGELRKKAERAQEEVFDFLKNNHYFSAIGKMGFSVVLYDIDKVGFINYEKSKELPQKSFYGFDYKILDGFDFANKVKPTDEEIEQITEIVGQPL